jgi:sortase A
VTERSSSSGVLLARRFTQSLVTSSTGDADLDARLAEIWEAYDERESPEVAVGRAVLLAGELALRQGEGLGDTGVVAARSIVPIADATPAPAPAASARLGPLPNAPVDPGPPLASARLGPLPNAPVDPGPPLASARLGPVPDGPVAPSLVAIPPSPSRAARRRLRRERRAQFAVAASWVRNTGLIILLFAAWQLWGTGIEHAHAQRSLAQEFAAHHHAGAHGPSLIAATVRVPSPPAGDVEAHLQIPAIGVDQYVLEGTGEASLAKGPGHYLGTAMPGQQGNVAIAGHRTTYGAPFYRLDELKVGDTVTLTTLTGQHLVYVVAKAPVAVSPRDVSVLNDAGDNRLTLTTCTPKYSATQRLVVVADLRTPAPTHHRPVRVAIVDPGSTPWNIRYLPSVLVAVGIIVALGIFYPRMRTQLGASRWLVLVPLWTGGLALLFVGLSGLLPATI